jgi:hypothetical protein
MSQQSDGRPGQSKELVVKQSDAMVAYEDPRDLSLDERLKQVRSAKSLALGTSGLEQCCTSRARGKFPVSRNHLKAWGLFQFVLAFLHPLMLSRWQEVCSVEPHRSTC